MSRSGRNANVSVNVLSRANKEELLAQLNNNARLSRQSDQKILRKPIEIDGHLSQQVMQVYVKDILKIHCCFGKTMPYIIHCCNNWLHCLWACRQDLCQWMAEGRVYARRN